MSRLRLHRSVVLCHLAAFPLAFQGLFAKLIAQDSLTIILGRSVVAAGALGLFLLSSRSFVVIRKKRDLLHLAVLGSLVAGHWVTMFHAIQCSSVAVALSAVFTFPLMTSLLEPLLEGTPLRRQDIVGAVLICGALGLMTPQLDWHSDSTQGIVWGLCSAFIYSLRNIFTKRQTLHYSKPTVMLYQLGAVALCTLPAVWLGAEVQPFSGVQIGYLLLLGVVCTAVGHTLFITVVHDLTASRASQIISTDLVYAIGLSAWLLHEVPDLRTLLGSAIILLVGLQQSRSQT